MNDYDEELAAEQKMITDYIAANPWPSYAEMSKRIMNHFDLYAEYGEMNHMALKVCYENILDKKICFAAGKSIAKRGGLEALRCNYYAFKCFGPFSQAASLQVRYCGCLLEHNWDGIESDGHIWRS
jgi:hypothetical protein